MLSDNRIYKRVLQYVGEGAAQQLGGLRVQQFWV